ncbi:MAG: hypothetical protein JWN59_79, partial [Sphingomonas bacterium]|nr:hypothetical protein [Sphingomonas bacterium]
MSPVETAAHVKAERLSDLISPANINTYLTKLCGVSNWASKEELIERNPALGLKVADTTLRRDKRDPFSTPQLQAILPHLSKPGVATRSADTLRAFFVVTKSRRVGPLPGSCRWKAAKPYRHFSWKRLSSAPSPHRGAAIDVGFGQRLHDVPVLHDLAVFNTIDVHEDQSGSAGAWFDM